MPNTTKTPTKKRKYTPETPFLIPLNKCNKKEPSYTPIKYKDSEKHEACFFLPPGVHPTPSSLSGLFLPDTLLRVIRHSTNNYSKRQLSPLYYSPVTIDEILRFFAVYFYMGLVNLPSKRYYWRSSSGIWPCHSVPQVLTRGRFEYLWRNLHISDDGEDIEEE